MLRTALLALGLLMLTSGSADPGPQIASMMKTPASAFDLYLFRLYEGARCNRLIKNTNADEADLCMTSLAYDVDSNVLSAYLRVYPGAEAMDDFVDQDAAGRKLILMALLDISVRRVGALDSWGLLYSTPISYGMESGSALEKAFRVELATRTTVALSTSYDGVVYVATRQYDGSIQYFTNE
jgi:hypothetical protein